MAHIKCDLLLQTWEQFASTSVSFYLYSSWNQYYHFEQQAYKVLHKFELGQLYTTSYNLECT